MLFTVISHQDDVWEIKFSGDNQYLATSAKKYYAPTKLVEGKKLAKKGKIKEAVSSFKQVQKLDVELKINTEAWNSLCRNGSLNRQAKEVMFACNKAISDSNPNEDLKTQAYYRDSRGLALVKIGKKEKAIKDFQFFVDYSQANEKSISQRKAWIEVLEKGEDPFTDEVLESLKQE